MNIQSKCVQAYRKHKNLKIAAMEVGIPWQSVYVHLKAANEPVVGDKRKYGSDSDKTAVVAEDHFKRLVPCADDQNQYQFQSKIDFVVRGYGVDVKASHLKSAGKRTKSMRWAFSIKKQEAIADFFVCFGLSEEDKVDICLLLPGEIARHYTTISISPSGGKWMDYRIDETELDQFFRSLPEKAA